jgi:glycosyltransferase involved in cell wall biosynthesis
MRIVVLGLRGFPDIQGGVESHCEELFTRIAARGHEVYALGRKPYLAPGLTEYKGVHLLALPCPKQKFLEAIVHTFLGVFAARRLKPDILHIHAVGPSLLVPLARLLGMKVVTTNHGPDYERGKWGGIARTVLKLGETLGSRFSNAMIAISEPIAAHLEKAFGRAPALIPNGVVIRNAPAAQDALGKHGLVPHRYILAVGRLVTEKGFHDLVQAFLKARIPDWQLVIVGAADHEDAYSLALKQSAAAVSGVVMTGYMTKDPLAQIYAHAGLFVLPSYHEGLPIVLLEALSYGLPALASDIPANRQVGLAKDRFFQPGDVDDIARKIRAHTTRPFTSAEKIAQLDFVARHFDWDAIAEKTIRVYENVLDATSSGLRTPRVNSSSH